MIYNIDTPVKIHTVFRNWNNINNERVEVLFTLPLNVCEALKLKNSLPAAVEDRDITSTAETLFIPIRPPLLTHFLRHSNGFLYYELHGKTIKAEVVLKCNEISSTPIEFTYIIPCKDDR